MGFVSMKRDDCTTKYLASILTNQSILTSLVVERIKGYQRQ